MSRNLRFTLLAIALAACAPAPTPLPTIAPPTVAPTAARAPVATASPTNAALIKITLGYSAVAVSQLPLWVAYEQKLFQKYGLDPTMQYVASSATFTLAMLGGDIQIGQLAEDGVINSGLEGGDLVMIAPSTEHLLFSLYTKPGITKLEDLKGKKIGVSQRGSASDFAARWFITHSGMKPDTDIALVAAGGIPEILGALIAGAVDGGVVSPPTSIKADQAGLKVLVDFTTLDLPFYQSVVTVRKAWLKNNPDTMRKFLKAYVEAIAIIKKDKATAKQILSKYAQTSDDVVLEGTYIPFVNILPQTPYPRIEAVQVGLDQAALTNPKAKTVDPNQFIDSSWIEELDKSGFIAGLYK